MSDTVKLGAKLGKDEDLNGLDSLAQSMIDDPRQVHVAVVWFDCSKIVENPDEDTSVPYARIRRFEPIGTAEDVDPKVRDLVLKAAEKRTGRAPLPFGTVEQHEIEDDQ